MLAKAIRQIVLWSLVLFAVTASVAQAQVAGVTDKAVRIGSSLPLSGDSQGTGLALKQGMEAALDGVQVKGRRLELIALDDTGHPPRAVDNVKRLLQEGVFLFLGNAGTETSVATLPLLFDSFTPAFAFQTGSSILLEAPGDILNYRPRYADEFFVIVENALGAGIQPKEICIYGQNDAFGMAAVRGFIKVLENKQLESELTALLLQIADLEGDNPQRNFIGPVGVRQRDTLKVRDAFDSLADWEARSGNRCRLILAADPPETLSRFAGYAVFKGKDWTFGTVSVVGIDSFFTSLQTYQVSEKFFATQVVPPLDSPLAIVEQARKALGNNLNYISLEGYIIGRLLVALLDAIEGEITVNKLWQAAINQPFDLAGLPIDFTTNINGSNLITLTEFRNGALHPISAEQMAERFR